VRDVDFQQQLLGIQSPWRVVDVQVDRDAKVVETFVSYEGPGQCPTCSQVGPIHDHRERRWRHLDLYEFRAYVTARVPRVSCSEHGVHQIPVPWADGKSSFTALFERLVISLLGEMTISGVAKVLTLTWSEVDTIMRRAVARGLERRSSRILRRIGIDEKSVKKRHVYFTIVSDLEQGDVIWIGRGRKRDTLDAFWRSLSADELAGIEGVAMDMHEPYVRSTLDYVPNAADKIVFDKFHVMMNLTRAVDQTRRAIMREGGQATSGLKRTRYLWLSADRNLDDDLRSQRELLRMKYVRLGIAWGNKEHFAEFWRASTRDDARAFFEDWFASVERTFNAPMIAAARTLKRHLANLLTYIAMPITNAMTEGINSRIQLIKFRSRGFRNATRFERAIMFHCGGLDMNPAT
jgi:transposase